MQGRSFLANEYKFRREIFERIICMSIAEPDRNILGQDMINPKCTTQWSVMQQRNVSHSTVGIVASGYA